MKSAIIFILAAIFLSIINAATIPKLDKKTDQIEAGVFQKLSEFLYTFVIFGENWPSHGVFVFHFFQ